MERRLAAILATDVVGYSRLIRADEEGTLARLKALRNDLIDPKIAQHHGRIVKLMGDGMLAEFSSVVDAVRAAVDTQAAVADHNADLPKDNRIEFRVGINLGDVVIDGDDIHGDGVNVAARLEGMAEPGGICVSGMVYEGVRDRIDIRFDDMGEQEVKNIDRPVRVWRWAPDGGPPHAAARAEAAPLVLPDKPSIAVLPFDNMSADPDQEYMADGMTEDIITSLSRFRSFFVLARNSTFVYKGRAIDVGQVSRDLGAKFVVEGSVRKSGKKVRITAQLIDAESGNHVWAERFDGDIDDLFDLQDEVTRRIAGSVGTAVDQFETVQLKRQRPDNLAAWQLVLLAQDLIRASVREDNLKAESLLHEANSLDPNYSRVYAGIANCYVFRAWSGWSEDTGAIMEKAFAAARHAMELDSGDAYSALTLSYCHMFSGDMQHAVDFAREAVRLAPSLGEAQRCLGCALSFTGAVEETLAALDLSSHLNTNDPDKYIEHLARANVLFCAGDYPAAIMAASRCVELKPAWVGGHLTLAASAALAGQPRQANRAVDAALRINPRFTLKSVARRPVFVPPDVVEKLLDGLRIAGLPE